MSSLNEKAINWADEYCKCKEGEPCLAGAAQAGYIAGYRAAIADAVEALRIFADHCSGSYHIYLSAPQFIERVEALTDTEVSPEGISKKDHRRGGE